METTTRPGLTELVAGVRAVLDPDPHRTAAAVADVLRAQAPGPDLLSAGERQSPGGHLLHAEPGLSMTAIVWAPGRITDVHDHIAWCAFVVLQGVENEIRYQDHGDHLTEIGRNVNHVGEVSAFAPPGDLHSVHNPATTHAVSLHLYGADLRDVRSSVRRVYDLPVR
jgi:predicted metal-dependent enzyme (double-stranded beta helix superfamily)